MNEIKIENMDGDLSTPASQQKISYYLGAISQSLNSMHEKVEKIDDRVENMSFSIQTLNTKFQSSSDNTEIQRKSCGDKFSSIIDKHKTYDEMFGRDFRRINDVDKSVSEIKSCIKIDSASTGKARRTIEYIVVCTMFIISLVSNFKDMFLYSTETKAKTTQESNDKSNSD